MAAVDWRERVNARLRDLGLTIRDLAEQTGRGYSYLWKLLRQTTGTAPQRPSQAVREDIAKALGMLPSELEDELNLKDYLVESLHELPEAEMDRLTGGTPNDRFRAVLEWMQADPRWQSAEQTAAALGLVLETMQALLNGVAPEQAVYRQLQAGDLDGALATATAVAEAGGEPWPICLAAYVGGTVAVFRREAHLVRQMYEAGAALLPQTQDTRLMNMYVELRRALV